MKIESIKLHSLLVPLMHPYLLSKQYGLVTDTTIVVAEVHTDEGITGWGECDPWPMFTGDSSEMVISVLKDIIGPALIGKDPTNINLIHQTMDSCIRLNSIAKSAIDMACYDILGKSCGKPANAMIGGALREELPCFWSVGGGTVQETIDSVLDIKKRGFKGCMLKIGGADWKNDIARTLAARDAAGEDFPMVADANQGWDVETAVAYGKAVEKVGLLFIEQPVKAHDIDGLARIRRSISTPISADEGIVTIHDAKALIDAGACDAFSVKVTKHGGIMPTKQICEYAEVNNVKLFFNSMHEEGITQAASLQVAATVENLMPQIGHSFFSTLRLKGDITNFNTFTKDGMTAVPTAPGLGIEMDMENLKKFTIATFDVTQ